MNNRNSVKTSFKKSYCKVCHDAGKPETDYTSHYVRSLPDKQGNTTILCPTLLNTECRFCYGLGHTAKFCPALKKAEKQEKREEYKKPQQVQPTKKQDNRGGGFSALLDLDETDQVLTPDPFTTPEKVEEWPALGAPSKRVESFYNYASAIAKPVTEAAEPKPLPSGFQVLQKGVVYSKESEQVKPKFIKWTDYDSDDEDEYTDNTAWD